MPCTHIVQEAVARYYFGPANGEYRIQSSESPKICPICKASVFGYMPDPLIREVAGLFEIPEKDRNRMLGEVKQLIIEKYNVVEKEKSADLPYPGKSARFVCDIGNWDLKADSEAYLYRFIRFKSATTGSLLSSFSLCEGPLGPVILIQFQCSPKYYERYANVVVYLNRFDVALEELDRFGYRSKNPNELRILFNIIATYNEIPSSHFERIRKIVADAPNDDREHLQDPLTRDMIRLFGIHESDHYRISVVMKHYLTEKCLTVEKEENRPYPGKRATFVHCGGNWKLFCSGGDLCRFISFKSITENSWLSGFSVLGYNDGSVSIQITFSETSKHVKKYLYHFPKIKS